MLPFTEYYITRGKCFSYIVDLNLGPQKLENSAENGRSSKLKKKKSFKSDSKPNLSSTETGGKFNLSHDLSFPLSCFSKALTCAKALDKSLLSSYVCPDWLPLGCLGLTLCSPFGVAALLFCIRQAGEFLVRMSPSAWEEDCTNALHGQPSFSPEASLPAFGAARQQGSLRNPPTIVPSTVWENLPSLPCLTASQRQSSLSLSLA